MPGECLKGTVSLTDSFAFEREGTYTGRLALWIHRVARLSCKWGKEMLGVSSGEFRLVLAADAPQPEEATEPVLRP